MQGTYFMDTNNMKVKKGQEKQTGVNAKQGFMVDMKMWKFQDFRCLKPKKGVNPSLWPHYDMNKYRTARTPKELDKVEEISFDKNFFNLEDPTVWKAIRDPAKGPKIWKKTYGFDHVSLTEGLEGKANSTKCFMNCFRAEQSKFARKCRKGGGLFKCCMIR